MGSARTSQQLAAAVCACSLYGGLLATIAPEARVVLAASALALPVIAGWRWGASQGAALGALVALTHLVLAWNGISLPSTGPFAFLADACLLVLSGIFVGKLCARMRAEIAAQEDTAARYARATAGSRDGLWDWDVRTGDVFRSPRWREIAGEHAHRVSSLGELLAPIHADDVAGARAELDAHLRGETPRYDHAHRVHHTDGTWRWVRDRGLAARDAQGHAIRVGGLLTDISADKETEARLHHHAFHDALTGLPNRALFMDRVQHAVARARRTPTSSFAVLMLDLDRFKSVNDSLGHRAGDQLLMRVAERIGNCLREGDTVSRLAGDEFSVLLEALREDHEAERVAAQIQRALATPIALDGHDVLTSASIGIVTARDGAFDALSLLRRADQAMYAAKKQGRGRVALFEASAHASSSLRATLESSLSDAIAGGQLRVYFQPIVNIESGEVSGFEALVRWQHPKLGLISPSELLPVAEQSGSIVQLSDFVLSSACSAVARLERMFHPSTPFRVAVNLSNRELTREDLVSRVDRALRESSVPPTSLVLEVKESALLDETPAGQSAFQALRARGVRVHMDDFGTGYSSLSYLHRFPLDALKIDGSFTGRLHDNLGAEEVVRSVIRIAGDLHLGVVAEGVENREQLRLLRGLGCQEAQGFLFGAPLPLEGVEALLRRGQRLAVA